MPLGRSGKPRIFISHGTADSVLPIDMCSRQRRCGVLAAGVAPMEGPCRSIHPQLLDSGYEVLYREFSGGHTVPPEIVEEAVSWWLADRSDLSPPASP